MNKKCLKCNKTKSIIHFGEHGSNDDGRQIWCKDCMVKYQRGKYVESAEDRKALAAARREKKARLLLKVKATNPCYSCGFDEPLCLFLYPISPEVPKFSTSSGPAKARKALDGSAVICSNCRIQVDAGLLEPPTQSLSWNPLDLEPEPQIPQPDAAEPPQIQTPALPPGVSQVPG